MYYPRRHTFKNGGSNNIGCELLLLCCLHYITKLVLVLSCTCFLDFQIIPVAADIVDTRAHTPCVLFSFCYPCSVIYVIILSSKQYVICDKVFMLTSFNKNSNIVVYSCVCCIPSQHYGAVSNSISD